MTNIFHSILCLLSGSQGSSQVPGVGIQSGLSLITPLLTPAGSFIPELQNPPKSPDPLKVACEDDKPRLMGRSPSVAPYMPNGTPDTQPHHSPPVGHEDSGGRLVFKEPPRPTPKLPQFIAAPPSSTLLKPAATNGSVGDWLSLDPFSKNSKFPIDEEYLVTKRPLADAEVVISTAPSPVSIADSVTVTSTPILRVRYVQDLIKDHNVEFPKGVSHQIFDQLRFDKTMRQFNNIVGVQLLKIQVQGLFEGLNQLDSVIQSEGDRSVIQDAKFTLVEYVSRCVCDEVSENPFKVASIPACLDQYLPTSGELFMKQKMHELVLDYLHNNLFEMTHSANGGLRVLKLAIGLVDAYSHPHFKEGDQVNNEIQQHSFNSLSFSLVTNYIPDILLKMSDQMFVEVNQRLNSTLANGTSHLNSEAIWFRNKMEAIFLEEFVRRLDSGVGLTYLFRMSHDNVNGLIKLAIKLVDYPNQESSKGLVDCTNLLVTLIPDILLKMSDQMFVEVNQMLNATLATDTSHLNSDAIWFRNKMEAMFLKELARRGLLG